MFNIYLGIYIVAAIAIIAGGTFKLVGGGQMLGGILFFIGALVVFTVYGLKWFGQKGGLFSETPVSWPPTINTCPDYLVYYGRTMPDGTVQETCIDTIGVSKNGSLKIFPKEGEAPLSNEYYFSLVTKSTNTAAKHAELCQRAMSYGLTWEGITNGESCITPPGAVSPGTNGGGGGGGCPA